MFEKFLKVSSFYGKGTDRKFALLVHFCILLKMQSCGKTSAIGLYIKIKALFPLPFPRKTRLLFALFGYFWQEIMRGHKSKGKNQNVTYPISPRRFLVKFLNISEKKNELNLLMLNLMLKRLTPILNPKNEKLNSSYALF